MPWWPRKRKIRRQQVRDKRAKSTAALRGNGGRRFDSWRVLVSVVFIAGAAAIALLGERGLEYSIGQRIDAPIYAAIDFQIDNPDQTEADREAARAATQSYYTFQSATSDRVRADLKRLYQAAAAANTFEEYTAALTEQAWPADERAYGRLRQLVEQPNDAGTQNFNDLVEKLPLDSEYVVRDLVSEPREPSTTTDFILLVKSQGDGAEPTEAKVLHRDLVPQENQRALRGSAHALARRLRNHELDSTVEEIILAAFKEQPTIIFDQVKTVEEMKKAEEATEPALSTYEKDKLLVRPNVVLGSDEYELLQAHRAAYLAYLAGDGEGAPALRRDRLQQRAGLAVLIGILCIGLLVYVGMHQHRIFEVRARSLAFVVLILGTLLAGRLLNMHWPQYPELVYAPCLIAANVLAIVYPRRFAVGAMCIIAVLVATAVHASLAFLLALFVGVAVTAHQLDEIRSRTKLIRVGFVSAMAMMVAAAAGGLMAGQTFDWLLNHVLWVGVCALLTAFVVSGLLPFIERAFRIATSLTLLEWRDPTKSLLQLLAREAPGTYAHSLVLGTLAESACDSIGANGLLAQVGALYHDIGKTHKADYFIENQRGGISRHENLAPTMSLLIILGHVKDGMEMAREYRLPRVLHQFIAEHHGTSVVRYFHHMASEQQPKIASGKHDREVPEAEFRYSGPKPRTKESAVVMLCDGVEGAVRALNEPTVGRIESVVHQMIGARLNDGQLSDCDVTMREIRLVEESLVKSLCSIYHGRVAYPKAAKPAPKRVEQQKVSV